MKYSAYTRKESIYLYIHKYTYIQETTYVYRNKVRKRRSEKRDDCVRSVYNDRKGVSCNHIVFTVITKRPFNRRLRAILFSHFDLCHDYAGETEEGGEGEGRTERYRIWGREEKVVHTRLT